MTPPPRLLEVSLAAAITVLTLAMAGPAWAQGSNTTTPAPTPATPAATVTDTPNLFLPGSGGCAQQYELAINLLEDAALADEELGLVAEAVGVAAELTANLAHGVAFGAEVVANGEQTASLIAAGVALESLVAVVDLPISGPAAGIALQAAAGGTAAEGVANAAHVAALVAEAVGLDSSIVGLGLQTGAVQTKVAAEVLSQYAETLPNCNAEFTGTVEVSDGGLNVTGQSIFNDDVGVAGDVNVEGNVNASQVHATQGISADGGAIWLGDPNGTTYSSGITIGGGAVSGAGVGGAQAFTGDVSAIAIGNGARANLSGAVALGTDATSTGSEAVAIGKSAIANGEQDVVIGAQNTTEAGGNNTVVGNEIDVLGATSANNTVLGVGHQVTGSENFVGGDPNTIIGDRNVVSALDSNVTGDSNVAIGDTVSITGNRAIAVGNGATTEADDATAIGTSALASAEGSAAFGQGAVADLERQQVFGTAANTYTTPGITSGLSRARQAGALEVATTDGNGNLATDGGAIFEALSENQAGIAISMALASPSVLPEETFAIAINWGGFQQSHALGLSAMGVLARDVFGKSGRISVQGAIGASVAERSFGNRRTHTQVGGRAGFQLSW